MHKMLEDWLLFVPSRSSWGSVMVLNSQQPPFELKYTQQGSPFCSLLEDLKHHLVRVLEGS